MKKILLFIFLLTLPCLLFDYFPEFSKADTIIYAKVETENAFMYTTPNSEDKNKLFILPQTYFVKLINVANDDFYYCSYKDIKGYVKKNEVVAMNGTPAHPYVEGLFRTFSLEGLGIYSSPQLSSEKCLATIPYLTDDLIYYGTITGQELIPEKSDQWIYCKYNDESSVCGYVYSVFCDKVPKITDNTESFEIISNPFTKTTKPSELSPVAMGFIIVGVALPCLIVLFFLIKPTLLKDKLNFPSPKLRAKKNRDYFEFDDSDLN